MNATNPIVTNDALERAIGHFDSLSDMARQLGLSGYQVIQQWRASGRVPAEHCAAVEQLTGERSEFLNSRVDWGFFRRNGIAIESASDRVA